MVRSETGPGERKNTVRQQESRPSYMDPWEMDVRNRAGQKRDSKQASMQVPPRSPIAIPEDANIVSSAEAIPTDRILDSRRGRSPYGQLAVVLSLCGRNTPVERRVARYPHFTGTNDVLQVIKHSTAPQAARLLEQPRWGNLVQ
jgi:hypothetical protein